MPETLTVFEKPQRTFKLFRSAVVTVCMLLTPWAQAQQGIRLKARGAISRYGPNRQAGRLPHLPHHYVLEFRTYPGPGTRQELGRRGIRVLQYLPDRGLMVSSDAQPDLAGLEVTWAGALDPDDKISPLLQTQSTGAYLVVFQLDSDMQKGRQTVRSQGLDILENPALLAWQLMVTGSYGNVTSLAADDAVAYSAGFPGPGGGRSGNWVCGPTNGSWASRRIRGSRPRVGQGCGRQRGAALLLPVADPETG